MNGCVRRRGEKFVKSPHRVLVRVATKIFEGGVLYKEFIKGLESLSSVHYTRPGTCINRPLHLAWIQYQIAHPQLRSYTMPCLTLFLPQK